MNSLGIFVYHSLVMMLNFVCYLDGIKQSGSIVRAAHPFLSLRGREYKIGIEEIVFILMPTSHSA